MPRPRTPRVCLQLALKLPLRRQRQSYQHPQLPQHSAEPPARPLLPAKFRRLTLQKSRPALRRKQSPYSISMSRLPIRPRRQLSPLAGPMFPRNRVPATRKSCWQSLRSWSSPRQPTPVGHIFRDAPLRAGASNLGSPARWQRHRRQSLRAQRRIQWSRHQ